MINAIKVCAFDADQCVVDGDARGGRTDGDFAVDTRHLDVEDVLGVENGIDELALSGPHARG